MRHLRVHDDVVQGPLVCGVATVHLLLHRREESLGVEEAGHPVRFGAPQIEPLVQLVVPLEQASEPVSKGQGLPGLGQPGGWDTRVEEGVDGVDEVAGQGDGSGDGKPQVLERGGGEASNHIETVDFLAEMNRQRHGGSTWQLLQLLLRLFLVEQGRDLRQQVLADLVHDLFATQTTTAPASFGHGVEDGDDGFLDLKGAEGDVRIGVQAVDLGAFRAGKDFNGRTEDVDVDGIRDTVAESTAVVFVQLVARHQHTLVEVLLRERVHEQLIEVIRDAASVLDRADHVPDRLPGGLRGLLQVHLHQVVLQELRAGRQVGLVELVRHVPTNRTEFAALLDHGVQEAHHEQELAPLLPTYRI
mmetsp:Transcript_6332/g.12237  ORF Transcript_6332/g.12237 Transcript_6332/m.12237 type:complete len:359 (-) Transcript_6332:9696-10772(-)